MTSRSALYGLIILSLCALSAWTWPIMSARAEPGASFIDAHVHIAHSLRPGQNLSDDVAAALDVMTKHGVVMAVLAPPPNSPKDKNTYGLQEEQRIVRDHPDRFAFTAGGESLNVMIQETPSDKVTPTLVQKFERAAAAIVDGGGAGFGEIAAEHFSSGASSHPYESAPPDHPLIVALADIAAKAGMPVEIHMEALQRDIPFPGRASGPPNPPTVKGNIAAFERLLDHNKAARIVWLHAGWDMSGERTIALMRDLLARHANLYMTIKSDRLGNPQNAPFTRGGGQLKPEWIELLHTFPDRFVIGSDVFLDDLRNQEHSPTAERLDRARRFADALPPDLLNAIAVDNVKRIYRLSRATR
jgi:predicted TIM-barrel fold metal-dependent hydrolase